MVTLSSFDPLMIINTAFSVGAMDSTSAATLVLASANKSLFSFGHTVKICPTQKPIVTCFSCMLYMIFKIGDFAIFLWSGPFLHPALKVNYMFSPSTTRVTGIVDSIHCNFAETNYLYGYFIARN